MPNTRKNIGTLERFPSNLDKVEVVLVKLHKASNKPFVKTKERQAIPQILMGKGRKGRREVEEEAGSKERIRNGKEVHKRVKEDDIVNEVPAIDAFLSNKHTIIYKCIYIYIYIYIYICI